MSAADSEKSRAYKIVLMDRTTSPRVNRFLRELLDISVWDASTLMNKIPSVIMEGIPLHRAIEIKSQMGKFGLTIKIESVSAETPEEQGPEKVQSKPAAKPPKEKTRKTSKPKPTSQPLFAKPTPPKPETAAPPPSKKAPPPSMPVAKRKPLQPSRLTTRSLKRTPVFKILLPFFILLIIVIIIIYAGDYSEAPGFLTNRNIVQKQEQGAGVPYRKTVPTKEDLIARVKSPHTTQSQPAGGGEVAGSGTMPAGGAAGQGGGAGSGQGAGGGAQGSQGASGMGAGGGAAGSQGTPGMGAGGGSPGAGTTNLPDNAMAGLERFGSREGAGLSNEKFGEMLEQARKSLAHPDPKKALNDYNRFRMADLMKSELPAETADMLNGGEFRELNDQLKKAAQQANLKPEVSLYPEFTGVGLRVQTNLPDKAIVKVIIRIAGSKETIEYDIPVDMGTIEIPHKGGFPSGLVAVKVILMPFKDQPEEAMEAIGEEGENLKGDFVKGKGKLEYEGYLINRIARSRGDVGRDEAEAELTSIMAMQGVEDAELSDFEDFAFDRKLFVTISADGVDEADFIWKACRSTGLLTLEMDEPPKFLRLVVNGGQYFIPTYKCRKMLREYREDDRAGFDYLVNNLILL
ncbi:MAG: hypothetical protein H8E46_12780 [FCB group bacterium]|nr:hypothetical protein [FCB group bacterium]